MTVLIVDDHPGFCATARALLEAEGLEVVGETGTGAGAIAEAERLCPQLVLVDVHLPDIDGLELARWLRQLAHPPEVVLTSSRDGFEFGSLVATSGARGLVPKAELSSAALLSLLP